MPIYYRAVPRATIPSVTRNVQDYQDVFDWVYRIEDATKDYRDSAVVTQEKLKKDYGIDTKLVEVPDDSLMETKYVLARAVDVDPNRLKNQNIEPGKRITTNTDEILTDPEAGDTPFEGVQEDLDPEEK